MTRLSVNINKIATLRNARGGTIPNVTEAAIRIQKFGAHGITIHPRPDERHITRKDVYDLRPVVYTEFNIEGYPSKEFIRMVCDVKPEQVTLVPDNHNQLTSDHGWDTWKHLSFLSDVVATFRGAGIRTSIFIDPDPLMVEGASETGTDRIELYTEPYASYYPVNKRIAIVRFAETARIASELEIGINAGHDLNLDNLNFFYQSIPNLLEVSIGHALIADSLYLGLENTVQKYLDCLS